MLVDHGDAGSALQYASEAPAPINPRDNVNTGTLKCLHWEWQHDVRLAPTPLHRFQKQQVCATGGGGIANTRLQGLEPLGEGFGDAGFELGWEAWLWTLGLVNHVAGEDDNPRDSETGIEAVRVAIQAVCQPARSAARTAQVGQLPPTQGRCLGIVVCGRSIFTQDHCCLSQGCLGP